MKAKTKKRIISLIVLLVVLAGVIAAYLIISNTEFEDNSSTATSTAVTLISENSSTISSITFKYQGEEVHLIKDSATSVWYDENDRDFPVNQSTLNDMATAISSVTAVRELEDGDSGEYGLDDPSLTVSADFNTGTSYTLTLGDTNSFNSYVYVKDKDGKVYMFSDSLTETFGIHRLDLIQLDSPEADVDTNYLVSLDVTTEDGAFKSITDSAGMNELLSQSDAYECTDWVEYGMTAEKFAEYGIGEDSAKLTINYKAPVAVTDSDGNTVTQRVDESYVITFGNKITDTDDDGNEAEYIYYTVTGSEILYKQPIADYNTTMSYINYTEAEETEESTEEVTDDSSEAT